ncbi:MAG: hypothetical protein ACI4JD_01105, partial [Ruminococcus sp.]
KQSTNVAIVNDSTENISVPDEYSSKEVSTVEVYYRDTLTEFPNWETEMNLWFNYCDSGGKWSSVGTTSGTSFNGNIATWTYADGATNANRFGYITKQKDDIQKIVITYKDGSTYTINNTSYVETLTMTLDKKSVEITVNSTATITASNAAGSLSCSFNPEGIATATVNGNVITVTGSAAGSTTLTVRDGTTPIDVTVTVNEESSGGSDAVTLTQGQSFEKTADINNVSKVEILFDSITNTSNSNAGFDVHIGDAYMWLTYDGSNISAQNWDGKISVEVDGKKVKITNLSATISNFKIYAKENLISAVINSVTFIAASTYSLRSTNSIYQMPILQATIDASAETTLTFPMTIQIDGTNDDDGIWTTIVANLPAYDESGSQYYYWAVEDTDSSAGYDVSYSFDDGDDTDILTDICINAGQPGNGIMTVLNTKKESSGVEMPSTGGEGTAKFYYTGGALVLLSAFAGSNRFRRRLKERRTK